MSKLSLDKQITLKLASSIPLVFIRAEDPFRACTVLYQQFVSYFEKVLTSMGRSRSDILSEEMNFILWNARAGWVKWDTAYSLDYILSRPNDFRPSNAPTNPNESPFTYLHGRAQTNSIFCLMYPHKIINTGAPPIIQSILDAAYLFKHGGSGNRLYIIVPTDYEIPPELTSMSYMVDISPLSKEQVKGIIPAVLESIADDNKTKRLIEKELDSDFSRVAELLSGMTHTKVEYNLLQAVLMSRKGRSGFSAEQFFSSLQDNKIELINSTGILEYCPSGGFSEVGGLDLVKQWIVDRKDSFSDKAKAFGVKPPRGVLLLGSPGSGKSLIAKSISSVLELPMLKLDMTKVFNSLVGKSEEKLRDTLKLVDSCSPCVLFVDEIDKMFASQARGGVSDTGGSGNKVLGILLSWIQDSPSDVFVVFTANRVESIPPELLRRGRVDEIFAVDLPSVKDIEEILRIHIKKRRPNDPILLDSTSLLEISKKLLGYSAAEVEHIVTQVVLRCFNEKQRDMAGTDYLSEKDKIVPMSVAFKDQIDAMRAWAVNNARPASSNMISASDAKPASTPSKIGMTMMDVKEGW